MTADDRPLTAVYCLRPVVKRQAMKHALLIMVILAVMLTACGERIPVGTAVPGAPDVPLATPVIAPATATLSPVAEAKPAMSNASTDRGAKVWAEQNCNLCHGDQAAGRIGPKLAGTSLSVEAVAQIVRPGKGSMPAYTTDKLSDADLAAVYTWLQTLKD
jgi:mono/diheme cytochrome c family protein